MIRIVVGCSGGVDSALAAALLTERGFDVVGCFLKVAIPDAPCPWEEDLPMAHRVAAYLNIPLMVRDVSAAYEREVLEPMIAAYRAGETPNPDTTCNRYVKFDALAAVAREIGAEKIATGHYARVVRTRPKDGVIASEAKPSAAIPSNTVPRLLRSPALHRNDVELYRGLDHAKDQSYFLWQLTQEQLAMCEFPLGEWQKEDVRAEAKRRGLPNWNRDSTSGVCFFGQVNFTEFLKKRLQVSFSGSATVVTTTGKVIGSVPSAEALTIGQRVPLAGQSAPRYVVAQDVTARWVVVSASPDDPARYVAIIATGTPHWIGSTPSFPLRATARIRHRQEPVPCTIFSPSHEEGEREGEGLRVTFDTPLTGIAPGQAVVISAHSGFPPEDWHSISGRDASDRILGGATIVRTPFSISHEIEKGNEGRRGRERTTH